MAGRRLLHTITPGEEGVRLDAAAIAWLSAELDRPLTRSAVRRLIMAGAIRVNGRSLRAPSMMLHAGTTLEAVVDLRKLQAAERPASAASRDEPAILYEDDDLIAVAKPPGLVMHATADPRRANLFNAVGAALARRTSSGVPYLGLHHRLDVETSGVVLFTRQPRANQPLAQQFARGEVDKVYHALAGRPKGRLPRVWEVENRLGTSGTGRGAHMTEVATGGARAMTAFALLEPLDAALLVEARPRTGRKHQIRAHLADAGMPVLGDVRYGGATRAGKCIAPRVMLHAWQISVRHPVTGDRLTITCPYPRDFLDMLACLRRQG